MPTPPVADLTNLLHAWREGNGNAFGQLINQVYGELKVISAKRLNQSGGTATVTPTELLHEALIGIMPSSMNFESREHFFATMSLSIRSILVDRARAHSAQKRGGDRVRITLSGIDVARNRRSPTYWFWKRRSPRSKLSTRVAGR